MRILIADTLAPVAALRLREAGHEIVEAGHLMGDELAVVLANTQAQVLVVRSTRVNASHLRASPALSLVIRAGAGVNTIDLDMASRLGIYVSNCPGRNAAAVAELALGLLLAVDRRIPDNVAAARDGRWAKGDFVHAQGLAGRTLGVIGLGSVGRALVLRAHGLGMNVVAWSRSLTEHEATSLGIKRLDSPEHVALASDAISIHTALTPDTHGLVGRRVLQALRPGGIVINTARAGILDEAALIEALDGRDLWAGLDVFEGEPAASSGVLNTPLATHPRVYLTHHIGASTAQAQVAVAHEVARIVLAFETTGRPPAVVNLAQRSRATHCLIVRHQDKVGVLADVLARLRTAGINVQEMENTMFAGGDAAIARIRTGSDPSLILAQLTQVDSVLHAHVVPIPLGAPA